MTVLASTLYLIYTKPWLSQHCTRLDPSESGWKSGHLSVIGRVHGPFDQIVMTVLAQCGVHKKLLFF
jgi:hypothetical protein